KLPIPNASEPLPTPLPSSSSSQLDRQLLPPIALAPRPQDSPSPESSSRPPVLSRLDDSPLTNISDLSLPASPASSDDMPASTEIAPGIYHYAPGKLPVVDDAPAAAASLAEPRVCSRLVGKIRAFGEASGLKDGEFMPKAIHAFESRKMRSDLRQTAAHLDLDFLALTYDQLEIVLKSTYMLGGTETYVDTFLHLTRTPTETPREFMDKIDSMNYDVPEKHQQDPSKIVTRIIESFDTDFKTFCRMHSQFKDLPTFRLEPVDETDAAAVRAQDKSIGSFKDLLYHAWSSYASQNAKLDTAVNAALNSRGLSVDNRKRGLSTNSHVSQLPDPKRSSSFASNAAVPRYQNTAPLPALAPAYNTINTVRAAPAGRTNLSGHIATLRERNACFCCKELYADHSARACPHAGLGPFEPRYLLDSPVVVQVIEQEITALGRRKVPLAELETILDRRLGGHAPATSSNSIPIATRVNAVPAAAHISPDSSYE
ncbi:hypothetical protein HDZ31DRAFT_22992, partial [Schizophyllum fasciatum]